MKLLSKSGRAEVEVLGIIVLIVGAVIFAAILLPKIAMEMYGLVALSSAEVVSRDLAGFITISAAAPNRITIEDQLSKSYSYDASVDGRLVWVKLLTVKYMMKGEAVTKIAIDGLTRSFSKVNYFEVSKWLEGGRNFYDVKAELVTEEESESG